jgi:phenol hydroxylase P0 protein
MREYVPNIGQAYVRVTGERLGSYVEFEFSIDDKDLTVELIMPREAFRLFCEKHRARLIQHPLEIGIDEVEKSRPGLYRQMPSQEH